MDVEDNKTSTMEMLLVYNMPLIMRISRFVCITLGIPINGLILVVIIRSRHLWSTTRIIFWLIIAFLNFTAIIQALMELVIYYVYHHQDPVSGIFLCRIYAIFAGCPYVFLQSTYILATAERYLILAHPQFHRLHVSNARICWILLFILVATTGGWTLPYWTGYVEKECRMQFDWIILTLSFNCFLTTTCFVFQLWLTYFIRTCIRHSKAIEKSSASTAQSLSPSISSVVLAAALLNPPSNDSRSGFRRHQRNVAQFTKIFNPSGQRLSLLEFKSARILNIAILPYCFINILCSISGIVVTCYIKKNVMSNDNNIYWLLIFMLFLRVITLIYQLIYIPAMFAAQSKEFRMARRRCCLMCCRRRGNHKNRRNSPSGRRFPLQYA